MTLLPIYEVWSWVNGYEGRYEVSNRGNIRVWSKSGGTKENKIWFHFSPKTMRQNVNKFGYHSVVIGHKKIGDKKRISVHRTVAAVFCGIKDGKNEVNHINGIKSCNEWWNLEWVDRMESIDHAFRTGLIKPALGENQSNTKLKNEDVLCIYADKRKYNAIAVCYGVAKGTVIDIKNGRTWWHLTGHKRKIKPSEIGKFKV